MPGYHPAKFGCCRAYKNEDKALLAMWPNNSDLDNDSDHHLQKGSVHAGLQTSQVLFLQVL